MKATKRATEAMSAPAPLRDEIEEDLRILRAALNGRVAPGAMIGAAFAQVALGRLENDLEVLTRALDTYGLHLAGHGCGSKKLGDVCNCGLDNARERAGLPRTYPKNGPKPWAKNGGGSWR